MTVPLRAAYSSEAAQIAGRSVCTTGCVAACLATVPHDSPGS